MSLYRNKFACLALICTLSLQILGTPLALSGEPETQAIEIDNENKDFQAKPRDVEFSERSADLTKFTFKEIPRDLGLSMKESFWGWGALAFGLGAGLSAGLAYSGADQDFQNQFSPNAAFGHTTNQVIKWIFQPYWQVGVSAILWGVGSGTKHPKLALTGRALTEAWVLSMGVSAVGKLAFRRTRPNGGNFSFPSGHVTSAFSTASVLTVFYGWKAGVPSYILASLVAVSRVDSYTHFLSDALMGAVIGTVIGIGTAKFHKNEKPQYFFSSRINSEEAHVQFNYIF